MNVKFSSTTEPPPPPPPYEESETEPQKPFETNRERIQSVFIKDNYRTVFRDLVLRANPDAKEEHLKSFKQLSPQGDRLRAATFDSHLNGSNLTVQDIPGNISNQVISKKQFEDLCLQQAVALGLSKVEIERGITETYIYYLF